MLRNLPSRFVALTLVLACALSGCGQSSTASLGNAGTSSLEEESGQGSGYAFHIRYPQLQPASSALAAALRTFAAAQKREFLAARAADTKATAPAFNLDLEFNVARRTAEFVSVLSSGTTYTGGAHGAPIVASFNLHTSDDAMIALADLFTDPDAALQALSVESRRQLEGRYEARLREATPERELAAALKSMREWVGRGTEAKAENFAVFLVDGIEGKAIGLTLLFPPYQVAAYAEGTQQIEVPARLFYTMLRPQFRDAFIAPDAERVEAGAH